jgi:hypothetical protein
MREGTASSHGPLLTRKKKKKSQVSPFILLLLGFFKENAASTLTQDPEFLLSWRSSLRLLCCRFMFMSGSAAKRGSRCFV